MERKKNGRIQQKQKQQYPYVCGKFGGAMWPCIRLYAPKHKVNTFCCLFLTCPNLDYITLLLSSCLCVCECVCASWLFKYPAFLSRGDIRSLFILLRVGWIFSVYVERIPSNIRKWIWNMESGMWSVKRHIFRFSDKPSGFEIWKSFGAYMQILRQTLRFPSQSCIWVFFVAFRSNPILPSFLWRPQKFSCDFSLPFFGRVSFFLIVLYFCAMLRFVWQLFVAINTYALPSQFQLLGILSSPRRTSLHTW